MSRSRIAPGDGDRRHGTLNGYNNLDCRCAGCREAARSHAEEKRRHAGVPTYAEHVASLPRTHGTISRYHAGCRCEDCRRASREHRQRFRMAKKAAS